MKYRIESVAYDIEKYKDILNKFDAIFHKTYLGNTYAIIELTSLGDLEVLQMDISEALVLEEDSITIYDGFLE